MITKPINIGKLNKRITLLQYADTIDELGQDTQKWKEVKTVWATFKPIRGGEYKEAAGKDREEVTYKATMRYYPVTADMRIRYRERIFEITSVVNVEEADYMLELQCVEYKDREVVPCEPGGY